MDITTLTENSCTKARRVHVDADAQTFIDDNRGFSFMAANLEVPFKRPLQNKK